MSNSSRRGGLSGRIASLPGRRLALALAMLLVLVALVPTAPPALGGAHPGTAVPYTGNPRATPAPVNETGALLPKYRIISYYGFPGNQLMGILGEYDKDTLYAKLQDQAAAYQAADPSRPTMLAFEVIASVAQADPGTDGLYLSHTDPSILNEYADYTAAHNMILLLDVQFGRDTIQNEIDAVRPWLQRPNVQLALDPEFHVAAGEKPGVDLGSIPASWITYAQQQLVQISQQYHLPPKILLVHQFRISMIQDRDQLSAIPGVQLVLNADGFGDPGLKTTVYGQLVQAGVPQFIGVKLFYKQDDPLMTPEQILGLTPAPDVVIYQ